MTDHTVNNFLEEHNLKIEDKNVLEGKYSEERVTRAPHHHTDQVKQVKLLLRDRKI